MPGRSFAEDDPAFAQIVWGHFDMYAVSNDRSDTVATHFACGVADDAMFIIEGYAKASVGQDLVDLALHRNELFFRQSVFPAYEKIIRTDEFRGGAKVYEREEAPILRLNSTDRGNQNPSQTTLGKINIAACKKITIALRVEF